MTSNSREIDKDSLRYDLETLRNKIDIFLAEYEDADFGKYKKIMERIQDDLHECSASIQEAVDLFD